MIQLLKPWRRVPTSWACAECGARAVGSYDMPTGVSYYCDQHYYEVGDPLLDHWGYTTGRGALRQPWRQWMTRQRVYQWCRRLVRPACEIHGPAFQVDYNEFMDHRYRDDAKACGDIAHLCGHESHSVLGDPDGGLTTAGAWRMLVNRCPVCGKETVVFGSDDES